MASPRSTLPAPTAPNVDTHMVRGSLLPVHGPRDVHAARHGVDAEDLHGRLVGAHARDAVSDGDVVVFVRPDLRGGRKRERKISLGEESRPALPSGVSLLLLWRRLATTTDPSPQELERQSEVRASPCATNKMCSGHQVTKRHHSI